ncbi:hypothetical protein ACUUMB_15035 [Enterobacter kobei]
MKISKQQWSGIEETLKSGLLVKFTYQGQKVGVRKMAISETKLAYVVFAGDVPLMGCFKEGESRYHPLSTVFLRKRTINPHASTVRRLSAQRGGKTFLKRKDYRYLTEERIEVTDSFFPTARTVVSHFRKIEGLEVIPESVLGTRNGGAG